MRALSKIVLGFLALAVGTSAYARETNLERAKPIIYAKGFSRGIHAPFAVKLLGKVPGTKHVYTYSGVLAPESGYVTGKVDLYHNKATIKKVLHLE